MPHMDNMSRHGSQSKFSELEGFHRSSFCHIFIETNNFDHQIQNTANVSFSKIERHTDV